MERRATNTWVERRALRENERHVIDSLHRVAHQLDPFLDRRYDHLFGRPYAMLICGNVLAVKTEGMCLMQKGQYVRALKSFANALTAHPRDIELHYLRAQLFYRVAQFDSAAAQLRILSDSMERRQTKRIGAYIPRATIFYAQGRAYAEAGDLAASREAYERALVEDLAFYMASVRLAGLALATRDTAAAMRHFEHAVTVQPADAALRFYYGVVLSSRDQRSEAAEQYMRAIDINPYYAPPYLHLGQLLERSDLENAITAYHMYLARVAQGDSTRQWVLNRLRILERTP
jgi:tetratricopeptide (TPR) repeat protein